METKVAELTVTQLRQLIREEVQNILFDLLDDPDRGMELRDEIQAKLTQILKTDQKLIPAQTVANKLGLEW
jgi:ribosomal protein S24E